MKALTIREPWLSMIVDGDKTIETRTWATQYRGELLLTGSLVASQVKRDALQPYTGKPWPQPRFLGVAACVVDLVDCRFMRKDDEVKAACGLYPRAVAWVLASVRLVAPEKVRGRLRLWDAPVLYEDGVLKPSTV